MQTAVDYQLMSPWTNCIVVDREEIDNPENKLPELRQVPQHLAAGFEVADHILVRVLRELPLAGQACSHDPSKVDRLGEQQAEPLPFFEVLRAEGGRDVDDAAAVVERNVVGGDDAALALRLPRVPQRTQPPVVVEPHDPAAQLLRLIERLVFQAHQHPAR